MLPQELEVLPIPEIPRCRFRDPLPTQPHVSDQLLVARLDLPVDFLEVVRKFRNLVVRDQWLPMAGHEYRVRKAGLCTHTMEEGHVGCVDVVGAPAEKHRVEGDYQCGEARCLCAT